MKSLLLVLAVSALYLQSNAQDASDDTAFAAAASSSASASASAAASSWTGTEEEQPDFAPTSVPSIACNCAYIYDPVCGSDGVTYSNECILRCISYYNIRYGRPPIYLVLRRPCPEEQCVCTQEVNPVCGTDGVTYSNRCRLICENRRRARLGLPPINISYYGPCRQQYCPCSNIVLPVCGSDGRTYRNLCFLQCASRVSQSGGGPVITPTNRGPCRNEICSCSTIYDPLCASDGRTYRNQCTLQCQNRRRNALGLYPLYIVKVGAC